MRTCIIPVLITGAIIFTPVCTEATQPIQAKIIATPPTSGSNTHYIGNRSPLAPNPLIKLPATSVSPSGWLRRQLELEAEGFSGYLTEISPWCKFEGNAWVNPKGEGHSGWEELPYWLKGFVALGYAVQNKRIIAESKKWIEGILSTQRPDGYFGPQGNLDASDLWPNMIALYAIRTYYEATGDQRVIPFMLRYFHWMYNLPNDKLLTGGWQNVRGGDNLDHIYWLYNHTGEEWLLELAERNHERTDDWTNGIASWHGVNFAQGFREPAQYYQQAKDPKLIQASERNFKTMMDIYGQVPGGLFGADENCRDGYFDPRQATETCTMAEFMFSDEMLTSITGIVSWADHCETVAFNSLPASMTPDLKGLHYLTAPNMVQCDRGNKAPGLQNGGEMLSYNPYNYRCCQHNIAFAWPYFSEYLWMATRSNGLAAVLYAPSKVKARVGSGAIVQITETTDYPFDENITFTFNTAQPVKFQFMMRIPSWCTAPKLKLNGSPVTVPKGAKGWISIDRTWKTGDKLVLTLPMDIRIKTWQKNNNCVSVYRGPLAYSLKIGEDWKKFNTESPKWPGYEVFPTTPWNYGLVIDQKNPTASFKVVRKSGALSTQPFTPQSTPMTITAKGKRIPEWKLDANGLVETVPKSPAVSSQPTETITLIPMGCARLRISAFPQISVK